MDHKVSKVKMETMEPKEKLGGGFKHFLFLLL